MTPEAEKHVIEKVNAIYVALFGIEGQPSTGSINRLEDTQKNHGERISRLELWRSWLAGGIAALSFALGMAVAMLRK